MKICMPVVESNGRASRLSGHFGSAPWFAIYDADSGDIAFVRNDESAHEHGSCMPVEALRKSGAETVLCKGMGMRAIQLLTAAGITPCSTGAETVDGAIADHDAGRTPAMDAASACRSHGCH